MKTWNQMIQLPEVPIMHFHNLQLVQHAKKIEYKISVLQTYVSSSKWFTVYYKHPLQSIGFHWEAQNLFSELFLLVTDTIDTKIRKRYFFVFSFKMKKNFF